MSDIVLSYVKENTPVAVQIARGREAAGRTIRCCKVDNVSDPSTLLQAQEAIEESHYILLLVSSELLGSFQQVPIEVSRAHEAGKPIILVLSGVTLKELKQEPRWRQIIEAATSIDMLAEEVEATVSHILRELEKPRVPATGTGTETGIAIPQQELSELEQQKQPPSVAEVPPEMTILPTITSPNRLQKTRLHLIRLVVVVALVIALAALVQKNVVTIDGNLTVNQVSFVLGSQGPVNVFNGVKTKTLQLQGIKEKEVKLGEVKLGEGRLEAVATRDPQSGDPLTWYAVGQRQSAFIKLIDSPTASVTFYDVTLNDLRISPASRVILRWLETEPLLLRLVFDKQGVTGRVAGPPSLHFSCTGCQIRDENTGQENSGTEWRFVRECFENGLVG